MLGIKLNWNFEREEIVTLERLQLWKKLRRKLQSWKRFFAKLQFFFSKKFPEEYLLNLNIVFFPFLRFRYLEEMGLAEREAEMQELETSRPGRSRDLFGVQLEVIAFKILFASTISTFNQKFFRSKIIFTQIPIFSWNLLVENIYNPLFFSFSFSRFVVIKEKITRKYNFSTKILLKNF